MQNLRSFVNSSSVVDFAFIIIVIMIGLALVPTAIGVFIKAKSRKPFYVLLALALVPVVVALLGGAWRYHHGESLLDGYLDASAEARAMYQDTLGREFLMMCVLGVAGGVVPFLTGVAGLLVKKPAKEIT